MSNQNETMCLCPVCCYREAGQSSDNEYQYQGWCQRCQAAYMEGWLSPELLETAKELLGKENK